MSDFRRASLCIGALACSVLLVAACSSDSEDPAIAAGHALYEANCQMCHGETALGDGPMAASLPVEPESLIEHLGHHTMAELTRLITAGIPPAMPPAAVDEAEAGLIVDYLWTLVPEEQVAGLREMQRQMEERGQGAGAMPGGEMDPSEMPGMQGDSANGAMPQG
jgi:mono/diheme cytochrome c family protein